MNPTSFTAQFTLGSLAADAGIQVGPFGSQLHVSDYRDAGVAVVMPAQIIDESIRFDECAKVSEAKAESLATHRLVPGDIVFARRGDIGRLAVVPSGAPTAICGTGCIRVRLQRGASSAIVAAACRTRSAREWLIANSVGMTMLNINQQTLARLPLSIPPRELHTNIETALGSSQSSIQALSALIAAKREQKRGLMQQLLTGKVRFPGFTEPWQTVRLQDVAEVRFSNVDKHTHTGERAIRLCNYTDVFRNRFIQPEMDFMTASASDREIEKFGLQAGDVAITKDSETPDEIGVAALIERASPDLVLGYHLALLRANRGVLDPGYLLTLMESDLVRAHFQRRASGLTRFALSTGAVADTPILLPSLKEQSRIANVYRDLTTEEGLLKQQRTTFESQRRGLMERLLSGAIDIPSTDTPAA